MRRRYASDCCRTYFDVNAPHPQEGPLMQSPCSETRYTVGCWSLTRPAILFIGRADGSMEVWDLLEKSHEPSEVQNITIHSITCIKPFSCELRRRAGSLLLCITLSTLGSDGRGLTSMWLQKYLIIHLLGS